MNKTICQDALELLESIPASDYINIPTDEISKCCALGHYYRLKSNYPQNYKFQPEKWYLFLDNNLLSKATKNYIDSFRYNMRYYFKNNIPLDLVSVNNFQILEVAPQLPKTWSVNETKERVINFLQDAIKAGY